MQTLRSRLVIALLRRRHLLRLQIRRPRVDDSTSIVALRAKAERGASVLGRVPTGVDVQPLRIGALQAEWIKPEGVDDQRTLLYFHGGGYVMGSLNTHRAVVAKFVSRSRVRALHFAYRLAPEHPFPAALDDALAVYAWLLAQGVPAHRVAFVGDSAGGGLCLATLLALKQLGTALPAAAAALSPWTDLLCTGPSYARQDPLAPPGSWQVFSRHYAGRTAASHPLISPLYGDLSGLPPLFLCAGAAESMADDSMRFAEKAREQQVPVQLLLGRGMVHCYPAFAPLFPEATQALEQICRFLQQHLAAEGVAAA